MLKVDLYNFEGKKKGNVSLARKYEVQPNAELLSQAVHVFEDRGHLPLAKAKTRSDVALSTRKIYRQKGTGGARHGAKSAPIFVGGGVTHGPKGLKRKLNLLKSQKEKALLFAINYKIKDSRLILLEGLEKVQKTKKALNLIKDIVSDRKWNRVNNITIALSEKNKGAAKYFRNIEGICADSFRNLNAYKVFLANGLIIDKEVFVTTVEKKIKSNKSMDEKTKVKKVAGKNTTKRDEVSNSKRSTLRKSKLVKK